MNTPAGGNPSSTPFRRITPPKRTPPFAWAAPIADPTEVEAVSKLLKTPLPNQRLGALCGGSCLWTWDGMSWTRTSTTCPQNCDCQGPESGGVAPGDTFQSFCHTGLEPVECTGNCTFEWNGSDWVVVQSCEANCDCAFPVMPGTVIGEQVSFACSGVTGGNNSSDVSGTPSSSYTSSAAPSSSSSSGAGWYCVSPKNNGDPPSAEGYYFYCVDDGHENMVCAEDRPKDLFKYDIVAGGPFDWTGDCEAFCLTGCVSTCQFFPSAPDTTDWNVYGGPYTTEAACAQNCCGSGTSSTTSSSSSSQHSSSSSSSSCCRCDCTVTVTLTALGGAGCGIEFSGGTAYSVGDQNVGAEVSDGCDIVNSVLINGGTAPVFVNDGDSISVSLTMKNNGYICESQDPTCVQSMFMVRRTSTGRTKLAINPSLRLTRRKLRR